MTNGIGRTIADATPSSVSATRGISICRGWLMARVTRRFFLLSSAALSAGCAVREPGAAAMSVPSIRQPAVGQAWRYAKHDLFTRALVDTQVDRVGAIDGRIEIDSRA